MKSTFFFLLAAILLSSCGGGKFYQSSRAVPGRSGNSVSDYSGRSTADKLNAASEPVDYDTMNRLVVYNAMIDLIVKNVDSTNDKLITLAQKYGGYVVRTGSYSSAIRVKSDSLNAAVDEVSGFGKVTDKSISGEDVTAEYTDYSIRLANADSARIRYLALLAKAENVEEALLVEKELERLNGEIDSLKGKLNALKHLSDYSTITVTMNKKVKLGVLGYVFVGTFDAVKWLFVRG